jgi:hypothetical protein
MISPTAVDDFNDYKKDYINQPGPAKNENPLICENYCSLD